MEKLQEIFNAPYDYDGDARILINSVSGFEMWTYSSRHGYQPVEESSWPLRDDQVNGLLNKQYRLLNADPLHQFHSTWDYRLLCPEWKCFCQWLHVWYANKEVEIRGEKGKTYLDISLFFYDCPTILQALSWVDDQKEIYQRGTESSKELAEIYQESVDIIKAYQEEKAINE